MADRKSGYEKAAEASGASSTSAPVIPPPATNTNGLPPAERKARKPHTVRKLDDDLRATSQVMAILEKFPVRTALRIVRNIVEKLHDKDAEVPKISNLSDDRPPTLTIPGLEERDHA